MSESINLRDGDRVEVTPMILPAGAFGAQLYQRVGIEGYLQRFRWKKVGPVVISEEGPVEALCDMHKALEGDLISDLKVVGA